MRCLARLNAQRISKALMNEGREYRLSMSFMLQQEGAIRPLRLHER
jgi:hypothetical protein